MPLSEHLVILPILIPFVIGALMLFYDDRQRKAKVALGLVSVLAQLAAAIELLRRSKVVGEGIEVSFYLLGDWQVPFGITLVLDRLSAIMLLLTISLAIPALIYARAGWYRRGQHFQSLFQFLLMGLNGAFLTGDLFNLFVFFEVLLAASYGLLLHGSGQVRVRAGMQYVAINLVSSACLLIGISLIYGVAGTLSMAQLSQMVVNLPEADRPLFHAGAAIMGLAFMVKAGIWPLSFWLPGAYMASAAPVAAMFAVMTKVGVYVILRLAMLFFGASAGASAGFGADVLTIAGLLTLTYGFLGVLASQGLGRMTAHLLLISSGTVVTVTGLALAGGVPTMLSGALYYMVSSTLAVAALFLLIEPMSREEGDIAAMLALTADAWGMEFEDDEKVEIGLAIPATMMVLGLSFSACVLAVVGLPPLSGFVGKVAILHGLLAGSPQVTGWAFMALLLFSGFAALIGLARIGIQTFWASDGAPPKVSVLEMAPVILLIALIGVITIRAQDVLRFTDQTAEALFQPRTYSDSVFKAQRLHKPAPGEGKS